MDLFANRDAILERFQELIADLKYISELDDKVDLLNQMRMRLHEASPFANEPVDCICWVKAETVKGNDYNPNSVAPPEMRLLRHSIREDGYTQPIVAYRFQEKFTVIDGFHRHRVGKEAPEIRERLHGYLPVAIINDSRRDRKDCMSATIRHNRARGVHAVMPMTDLVAELISLGWSDIDVARELGMDEDEVLRFKQVAGLPELFKDAEFSEAWE